MKCNKCGAEILTNSKFCNKCGTKVEQNSKKEKKEMSKGTRIFVVILLSILNTFSALGIINGLSKIVKEGVDILPGLVSFLALIIPCAYGLKKNIMKLIDKDKKELTAEQVQKRKKRNTIFGLSSVTAVALIIVVMFVYGNISESKEKEQMISKIKEYQNNGYLELSDKEYQELETSSNNEIKERLGKIEENIKLQKEYNEKYSNQLDEIYGKQIQVELYQSEDQSFVYMPLNTKTGEYQAKAQVEYVTISKSANQIADIYYSVEMNLTVYNKYNGKVVSNGVTKKYYKIPYLRDLDKIKEINNYNDQTIQDEISNAIYGKTGVVVAVPSENINYKYDFIHVQ